MKIDTVRLFTGIELNVSARNALSDVRRQLIAQALPGKFHAPELYHLTLCFLGSTPVSRIPDLQAVMSAIPCAPFSLTLSDLGTFKNGTILWAGVEACPALHDYRARLADALRRADFPVEEGEYHPHITLARQFKAALPTIGVPRVSFPVPHAALFESTRIDGVLTYLPLYRSVFH